MLGSLNTNKMLRDFTDDSLDNQARMARCRWTNP